MPPSNRLDESEAVRLLIQSKRFFGDTFPKYNDEIWTILSRQSGGKWSKHNWYISCKQDRRNILTRARETQGLEALKTSIDGPNSDNLFLETLEDSHEEEEKDSEDDGETWFDLLLTPEEWAEIKPENTDLARADAAQANPKRSSHTLKAGVWSNIIADAFFRQFRLPCSFVFKRAEVNVSDNREHFLKIKGRCMSIKCGNKFSGFSDCEPPLHSGLFIQVKTRETTYDKHEVLSRPLNGQKRKRIGKEAVLEGSHNLQKRLRREVLKPGEVDGPAIPSLDALRHAKQEALSEKLGGKARPGEDLIQTIYRLKYENPYTGSIHDIGYSPFRVIYGTYEQRALYKKYIRLNRNNSSLCIDSSGSMIKPLTTPVRGKTAHIFMYCLVLHFDNKSVSVFQMLSECGETEKIVDFLKTWLRTVDYIKPKQIVMDGSRALLLACSLAFNDVTIKHHNSICLNAVLNNRPIPKELISTFIRADVSHFFNAIVRSKPLLTHPIPAVSDFYKRCVGLLVECQTISDFLHIFVLTLVVAYEEHDDSSLRLKSIRSAVQTPSDARAELLEMIKKRPLDDDGFLRLSENQNENNDKEKIQNAEKEDDYWAKEYEAMKDIVEFFEDLEGEAKFVICEGSTVNYYCLPVFGKQLIVMGRECPTWSAACIPYFAERATSSYVERVFREIKLEATKQIDLPAKADTLIKIHLTDLIGGVRGVNSILTEYEMEDTKIPAPKLKTNGNVQTSEVQGCYAPIPHTPSGITTNDASASNGHAFDDSDLRSIEDWRGKSKPYTRLNASLDDSESFVDENHNEFIPEIHAKTGTETRSEELNESRSFPCGVDYPSEEPLACQGEEPHVENDWNTNLDQIPTILIPDTSPRTTQPTISHQSILKKNPKRSKFFRSFPEISRQRVTEEYLAHKQKFVRRVSERNLLKNGVHCGTVTIDRLRYLIRNTCPFDSMTAPLFTALMDDSNFYGFLKQIMSDNLENGATHQNFQYWNFLEKFLHEGTSPELYKDRFILLKPLYEKTCVVTEMNGQAILQSYDGWDNPIEVWLKLMAGVPSALQVLCCENCGEVESPLMSLIPNHKIIIQKGFTFLQEALDRPSTIFNKKCCGKEYMRRIRTGQHIFVELDVREMLNGHSKHCKLKEFPLTLKFEYSYRLAGIITGYGSHFTAYCHQTGGRWEEYDDLRPNVTKGHVNDIITPVAALYIMEPTAETK